MATMTPEGLQYLTKRAEGCELTAYRDETGTWTIGWGHTFGVAEGLTITQEQADALLAQEVQEYAAKVEDLLLRPASPHQFDALVDFAYNEGVAALQQPKSSILAHFNAGEFVAMLEEMGDWDADTPPHIAQGLVRRRNREVIWFLASDAVLASLKPQGAA